MKTFLFPYHSFENEYPDNVPRVQFGGGYVFTSQPTAPDQRSFTLNFTGMGYRVYKAGFDATHYNATYADVVAAGVDPWKHFVENGLYEGRSVRCDGSLFTAVDFSKCCGCLELFYQYHSLWRYFTYEHPTLGTLTVKFSKPLHLPKHAGKNTRVLADFTVSLIEVP